MVQVNFFSTWVNYGILPFFSGQLWLFSKNVNPCLTFQYSPGLRFLLSISSTLEDKKFFVNLSLVTGAPSPLHLPTHTSTTKSASLDVTLDSFPYQNADMFSCLSFLHWPFSVTSMKTFPTRGFVWSLDSNLSQFGQHSQVIIITHL